MNAELAISSKAGQFMPQFGGLVTHPATVLLLHLALDLQSQQYPEVDKVEAALLYPPCRGLHSLQAWSMEHKIYLRV
jgi:hypothetical protein